jgi:lysophospholipase L1-like esterase
MNHRRTLAGLGLALVVALCAPGVSAAADRQLYVSVGDSYAMGYQPHGSYKHGFANQLTRMAPRRGYDLELVNFGCGGATTMSILHSKGCRKRERAFRGAPYRGRTQAAAAERFLRRHRGRVALVTVSIGGNDVTACARAADPIACVSAAVGSIKENVRTLARGLRRAAGRKVRIVGITYPDVILGSWVRPPTSQPLARLSVVAFRSLINPALKDRYKAVGGRFVDVTAATGAYGSLDDTTTLAPWGVIPTPVAEVCTLTWYCALGDIHPRNAGYKAIAKLVLATLPRRY